MLLALPVPFQRDGYGILRFSLQGTQDLVRLIGGGDFQLYGALAAQPAFDAQSLFRGAEDIGSGQAADCCAQRGRDPDVQRGFRNGSGDILKPGIQGQLSGWQRFSEPAEPIPGNGRFPGFDGELRDRRHQVIVREGRSQRQAARRIRADDDRVLTEGDDLTGGELQRAGDSGRQGQQQDHREKPKLPDPHVIVLLPVGLFQHYTCLQTSFARKKGQQKTARRNCRTVLQAIDYAFCQALTLSAASRLMVSSL